MAEALLDLASRPDGLTVTLLTADGAQPVATALVPRADLDQGTPGSTSVRTVSPSQSRG